MVTTGNVVDAVRERCVNCSGRKVSICNVIEDDDLPALVSESTRVHVASGRTFIEEGSSAHDFYVLTSGRAKLFNLMPDGRRQIIGFAEVGDFLGLAASETYAFSAETLEDVTLCRFPHSSIERLIQRFPRLQNRLREEASIELIGMQSRLMLLGRKTAKERLASFLIEQAKPCCRPNTSPAAMGNIPIHLHLPMSRTDIADYLGLTIETVSRTFGLFKKEKLITIQGVTEVTLLGPSRLANLAEGIG